MATSLQGVDQKASTSEEPKYPRLLMPKRTAELPRPNAPRDSSAGEARKPCYVDDLQMMHADRDPVNSDSSRLLGTRAARFLQVPCLNVNTQAQHAGS